MSSIHTRKHRHARLSLYLAAALPALSLTSASLAITSTWTAGAGGDFSSPHWFPSPPGPSDTALLNPAPRSSTYTISFSTSPTTDRLSILDDHVTLDLADQTYTLTNPNAWAGSFAVEVSSPIGDSLTLTSSSPAGGSLVTQSIALATSYHYGASLTVRPGATLTSNNAYIGANSYAAATATVDGSGARWDTPNVFNVGFSGGAGTVNVLNGATVSAGRAYLGASSFSNGTLLVDGPDSSFSARGGMYVGYISPGSLTARNGATLSGAAAIGFLPDGVGSVSLDHATWNNAGFTFAEKGRATASFAHSTITGGAAFATNPGSSATVTLDASTWTITNGAFPVGSAGGTASLSLLNGSRLTTTNSLPSIGPSSLVTVDGPGSAWHNTTNYGVPFAIAGALAVTNGASVDTATTDPPVGGTALDGGPSPRLSVTGPASSFSCAGPVTLGPTNPASLALSDAGSLSATATVTIHPTSTLTLHDGSLTAPTLDLRGTLTGRGSLHTNLLLSPTSTLALSLTSPTDYDHLASIQTLTFAGTLSLTASPSYTPHLGDSFDLLDFTTRNGSSQFSTLSLPTLPPDLSWDTSSLYTTGTLTILPEPSALACLFARSLLPALTRRRIKP